MQLEENEHIQGESAQSEAYRHIDDNVHREVQVEGKVEEANLELKSIVKVQADGKKIQMEEIDTCTMEALSKGPKGKGFFNPCCTYPCENGGVCIPKERDYICICENLEYFGKECHRASWTRWLKNMLFPSEAGHSRLTGLPLLWTLINYIGFLNSLAMSHLYLYCEAMFLSPPTHIATSQDFISMDSYYNRSYYTRDLPPIPQPCPTAMGFEGPIELPPIDTIIEKALMRENFKVNMQATNVLFVAYAQHFLRQFFKADFKSGIGMAWGEDGVDASQIYGKDEETRRVLRSYKDGKLKVTVIRNEDYPPLLSEVPTLYKTYPAGPSEILGHDRRKGTDYKWALGDPLFNTNIWLFVIATVWLREHNRVCTVLQKEHPNWNDERLYQTARLIITGEMIKITMEDYLQHLTQYKLALKYKPELLHHTNFQYSNRIRQEYNFMHYWQAMEPEEFEFQNRIYDAHNFNFLNNSIVDEHGIDGFMKVMVDTPAGEIGYKNYPHSSFCSLKRMLALSREMRMQSFNNYRKAFGMSPYKNFLDMTGDPESAQTLQELYQDVNAVEFFVGVVTEKKEKSMLGQTTVIMSTSWTIKTLMSNAIGSPGWWKTVTFGGKIGMNIIKKATLRKLICRNLQRKCECSVSFTVPYDKFQAVLKNVYEQQLEKFVPKKKCGLHQSKLQ